MTSSDRTPGAPRRIGGRLAVTAARARVASFVIALVLSGCSSAGQASQALASPSAASTAAATAIGAETAGPTAVAPSGARTLLVDTDVATDDLVALTFLLSAPMVDVVGITVSGTGEAHCAGGVDVVLRLLERLDAPDIPVACGRETPLAGDHAFPAEWRERVDHGSGLELPRTDRKPADLTAVELIGEASEQHDDLVVLTLGPLTNLAEALLADDDLVDRLDAVYVMGGALYVPGNLVCCGAPEGNAVGEWNIYVDPRAAQVLVESGVTQLFVPLDGTNQAPVTPDFAARAMVGERPAARILADLFAANDFMTDGSYYLWDPLAAMLAAGYRIGTFTPAAIEVEEAEGPESGFTRPTQADPNIEYLSTVDAALAEATLLGVLNGSGGSKPTPAGT